MGHTGGLGTAQDYQVTDSHQGYGVCIHIALLKMFLMYFEVVQCHHTSPKMSIYLQHNVYCKCIMTLHCNVYCACIAMHKMRYRF